MKGVLEMLLSYMFSFLLATQIITSPNEITITKNGKPITRLDSMDFFHPYFDLPIMDSKKVDQIVDQLNKQYSIPPKNAQLDPNGNIIPEKAGMEIDRQALLKQVYSHYIHQKPSNIELPMRTVYPNVDSELLNDLRSLRIGLYITSFNPRNKNRSTNIKLATESINNYVVFPGETFSFNKVVGKRTKERGYLRAKVIVKGEYAEDIGGGICQVSSTLFNAVDNAGLQIVQRFSHSREVPYIPRGRDATVSWYGPDFQFKNEYNQPVLIRAKTVNGLLIIAIYSSENIQYTPRKIPYTT